MCPGKSREEVDHDPPILPVVEGVHSILRKPFDIGELLEHINDAAQLRD